MLSLIVAMAHDRVIGNQGGMPWHLPADLAWFRYHTVGKSILMGRATWDSIGKALPDRHTIVISRSLAPLATPTILLGDKSIKSTGGAEAIHAAGITVVSSPEQALKVAQAKGGDEIMVVGGAQIYHHYLPLADRLYLTAIDASVDGDTYFPEYQSLAQWNTLEKIVCEANKKNIYRCTFMIMERTHTQTKDQNQRETTHS